MNQRLSSVEVFSVKSVVLFHLVTRNALHFFNDQNNVYYHHDNKQF